MEKTYYIYHIPSVKIGVSEEPKRRVKKQGYSDYEILETHTDIIKVSEREKELQKEYGYKVDKLPYWKTLLVPTKDGCIKGGRSAVESGQLASVAHLGGKVGGKIAGKISNPSYHLRKLDYQTAEYIRAQYARKVDFFDKPITQRRLAKVFGVSQRTIQQMLINKNYTQL